MGVAIIGREAIRYAAATGEPLRVYQSYRTWFRAWCELGYIPGAAVVDWRDPAAIFDALADVQVIECETPQLHLRLTAVLEREARARMPAVRVLWWREQIGWADQVGR